MIVVVEGQRGCRRTGAGVEILEATVAAVHRVSIGPASFAVWED